MIVLLVRGSLIGKKKREKFDAHVGGYNSIHNQAWSKFELLRNQKQHIEHAFMKQADQARRI